MINTCAAGQDTEDAGMISSTSTLSLLTSKRSTPCPYVSRGSRAPVVQQQAATTLVRGALGQDVRTGKAVSSCAGVALRVLATRPAGQSNRSVNPHRCRYQRPTGKGSPERQAGAGGAPSSATLGRDVCAGSSEDQQEHTRPGSQALLS